MSKFLPAIIIFCLLASVYPVFAYVMSSDNYRIGSDSINVGGVNQTSTNYKMEDTIGEIATGISTTTSYKLMAGYRQMQEVYLAISLSTSTVNMGSIGGVTGGTVNGAATSTVITDSVSGYTLSVRVSTAPALKSDSYGFTDYTPFVAGTPTYNWGVSSTDAEFGFSPEGSHLVQKFKDDGSSTCNAGSSNTVDVCWYNFSTADENIASSYLANHPSGTATAIKFRAQSGALRIQKEGTYTATITVTAIAN